MRISIVAVGKLKERFWREASDEYLKRLRPYADVRIVEVADRDPGKGGEAKVLAEEGVDILRSLADNVYVIALDVDGRERSSEDLAALLGQLALGGRSSVAFVVGGSLGLSAEVKARADERLSMGPMTLPHNLARVVILEQVYRAFRINRGEPYHK